MLGFGLNVPHIVVVQFADAVPARTVESQCRIETRFTIEMEFGGGVVGLNVVFFGFGSLACLITRGIIPFLVFIDGYAVFCVECLGDGQRGSYRAVLGIS